MIADLLPTRLVWEAGRGGIARRNGTAVRLSAPPDLGAGPVLAADYVPGQLATVQYRAEGERDMRPAEREAADALLRQLTTKGPIDAPA